MAAEGFRDLVVVGRGSKLGGEGVAVEELHRMVLEGPDAVVADDPDDGQVVAGHGVELHAGEAEGAVAEEEADLSIGAGLGRPDRLAGAGAEAAEGAGGYPRAGLVGLDVAAGVGDEVAAVADHDRVAVEDLAELLVDADADRFYEIYFGFAQEGRVNAKAMPGLLDIATVWSDTSEHAMLAKPPALVQNALFRALAPIARM